MTGAELVAAIVAEMAEEGVQPTAKEDALLRTVGQLVDRLAALEAAVERDGEILVSKTGVTRIQPAVSEHRQVAATLPKVLAGIVVGDSHTSPVKHPAKVAAANAPGGTVVNRSVRRRPRGWPLMGKPLPRTEDDETDPHAIPERLLRCYVEEWCDPGNEPVESWRGDIRPGTSEWTWHWQLVARRRQRNARATYCAEHDITDPWPAPGRPMWRREPT